jgi:hypothetical protein
VDAYGRPRWALEAAVQQELAVAFDSKDGRVDAIRLLSAFVEENRADLVY